MGWRFSWWVPVCLVSAVPQAAQAASPGRLAAAALAITGPANSDTERARQCLTLAIAYEAGNEPLSGRQAVAEVILNRMRHPAYPKSVCGVVFQGSNRRTGCQFTFTCDGALKRRLSPATVAAAREIAGRVLAGEFTPGVGGATHYHANYVSPYWAPSLIRVARIGAHIFYRAPASPDLPARYAAASEPLIAQLGHWLSEPDALTRRDRPAAAPVLETPRPPAFTLWGLDPAQLAGR